MTIGVDYGEQTDHSSGFPLNASEWNSRIADFNTAFQDGSKDIYTRQIVYTLNAGEDITAGNAVRTASGELFNAVNTSAAGITNVIGMALDTVTTGNPCTVALNRVEALSGLTPGILLYVGATGPVTGTKPSTFAKAFGIVLTTSSLMITTSFESDQTFSSINVSDTTTLGAGSYESITIEDGGSLTGYNGSMDFKSTTVPGSGTANFLTNFNATVDGGTTRHDVAVDRNLVVNGTPSLGSGSDGVFFLGNGNFSAAITNGVGIVSEDLSPGNTTLALKTEGTIFFAGTPAADTGALAIVHNGSTYYLRTSTTAPS